MICTVPPLRFVTVVEPVGAPVGRHAAVTSRRKRGRHNSSEFNSLRYSHYARILRRVVLHYNTHLGCVRQTSLRRV